MSPTSFQLLYSAIFSALLECLGIIARRVSFVKPYFCFYSGRSPLTTSPPAHIIISATFILSIFPWPIPRPGHLIGEFYVSRYPERPSDFGQPAADLRGLPGQFDLYRHRAWGEAPSELAGPGAQSRRFLRRRPCCGPGRGVSAQAYSQRNYTEDALNAVGDDLMAEIRRGRMA